MKPREYFLSMGRSKFQPHLQKEPDFLNIISKSV